MFVGLDQRYIYVLMFDHNIKLGELYVYIYIYIFNINFV